MCGRFAASASTEEIVATFAVDEVVDEPRPTFNAAPTDPVPAVVERVDARSGAAVRKLVTPRWGLVPSWATDTRGAARLINARVETVATKPAFRKAFATRRCLLPADGYFEWQPVPDATASGRPRKQPWFIRPADGGLFVMAGLYEFWRDPALEGPPAWLTTCTIITTTAADAVGHIHDRMPMVVAPEAWDDWLDPRLDRPDDVAALLSVAPAAALASWPVSTLVNSVRNDGPELVARLQA